MAEGKVLELNGYIFNLTSKNVTMVDTAGRLRACYYTTRPARVLRVSDDVPAYGRKPENVVPHADDCLEVTGEMEKIGVLNGVHNLVRPRESCADLRNFWRRMVYDFYAKVEEPAMKFFAEQREKLVRESRDEAYGIVSRGVVLILHYRGEPIDNLLVPAMPTEVCEADREITMSVRDGYQALMPAEYLLK